MDVFFKTQKGTKFSIEVGYFDTVLEIKQKIQKYQHIPVSKQTLSFNGKFLKDDLDIKQCDIFHNSCLQIHISMLRVTVMPIDKTSKIPVVEVYPNDNVGELRKELIKIQENGRLSLPQVAYFFKHKQKVMDEDQSFQWHQVHDGDTIAIFTRNVSVTPKKLRVKVLPRKKTEKIEVKLKVTDNVGELRKELIRIQKMFQLDLIQEEYVFIYGQYIMDEDLSFEGHKISDGETIKISNGTVSVIVLPSSESRKIRVEAKVDDNLGELKKELSEIQEKFRLNLPKDGYFFIHKQYVMDEDQSFLWHNVDDGDTIEIFESNPNPKKFKSNPEKMRVMVLTSCKSRKIVVEVKEDDKVEELRKKLEEKFKVDLPQGGYYFMHKSNVMDEGESFMWHHVDDGDTIKIRI